MRRIYRLLPFLAFSAIAPFFVGGCGSAPATSPSTSGAAATVGAAPERIAPSSTQAKKRDLTGYELLQGTIYTPAEAVASVTVPYAAPVARIAVKQGQYVNRGQLLFELEMPDVKASYTQAKDALQAAQAAYTEAQVKTMQPVRDAQRQLALAQDTEKQERANTQPGGDGSALQSAEAARQQAQDALTQARADANTNLLPYKQQLDQANQVFLAAKGTEKQGLVVAPISGTVLSLTAQVGQKAGQSANSPVGSIANLDAIEVKADMNDAQSAVGRVGAHVVLAFADVPDKSFDGRIARVHSVPDSFGKTVHEATILFRNSEHLVKPSSRLERVGVKTGEAKDVLTVPVGALQRDQSGKPVVMVLQGQEWKATAVQTGLTDGQFIEIKSGLKVGDTVQVKTVS